LLAAAIASEWRASESVRGVGMCVWCVCVCGLCRVSLGRDRTNPLLLQCVLGPPFATWGEAAEAARGPVSCRGAYHGSYFLLKNGVAPVTADAAKRAKKKGEL
jgi:hypothetical protein